MPITISTHAQYVSNTREYVAGFLAQADAEAIVALADAIIDRAGGQRSARITRSPQIGTVQIQVREPLAGDRFILADAIATNVEVQLGEQSGWGLRLGEDTVAVTAQAFCEAEYAAGGPFAAEVLQLASDTEKRQRRERDAEWRELQPTIVEFEEVL